MDRRTFLKALGMGGVSLLAAGSLEGWPRSSLAAEAHAASSIDDLALRLEFDPERIFRFVADQIRYEPYAGVLRGAESTLMARAGNSADQAVLLAALLRASGISSRFVQGELAPATVDTIVRVASRGAEDVLAETDAIIRTAAGELRGRGFPEPDESTRRSLARAQELRADIERVVERRLTREHSRLLGALDEAGVRLPAGVTEMPTEESIRHVWVQALRGPDWMDLDPVLSDATPGQRLADVAAILVGPEELPRHLVTFRAVAESVSSGALRTDVLLEHRVPADQLIGRRITFAMEKPDSLKALGAGIAGALTGSVQYAPLLIVGQDVVLPTGYVRFGGGDDVFGPALSDAPADGETTALWLEIAVETPDRPRQAAQRPIFDRVGDTARLDGAFDPQRIAPVELVDLDESAQQEYVPCRGVHLISVAGSWSQPVELVGSTMEPPFGYDALAALYHWMREAVGAAWSAPLGARPFCDGPNIAAVVLTPVMSGDELGIQISADLLSRSLGTVGVAGIPIPEGPGILAGVVSHVAERMLLGDIGVPIEGHAEPLMSVGRLFEEAERQGIPLTVLDGSDAIPSFDYPGATEASRLISTALRDGYVVVVPERPVLLDGAMRLGWWLIDRDRGTAWDQLDTGGGATLIEWAGIVWDHWKATPLWFRMYVCANFAFIIAVVVFTIQETTRDPITKLLAVGGGAAAGVPLAAVCGRVA